MHGQTNKDIGKNKELPCVIIKKNHFWREVALTYNQDWIIFLI
jgi:hypothetical protein